MILALATEASEASLIAAIFPTIKTALGLASSDLGIIVAANKLSGAICSPFWTWLARRWTRKGVMVLTAGVAGAFGMALGCANGFVALLVLSCVLAGSYGGAAPVITDILADLFDDRARGRAVGILYAVVSVFGAVSGALIAQLTGLPGGWRVGFWLLGGIGVATSLLILVLFRDPGVGATGDGGARTVQHPLTVAAAISVFSVPSFNWMLVSRLLSGHIVIASFGILFLTSDRHFTNEVAAIVLLPFSAGLCLGALGGGLVVDRMHARNPRIGRIAFLQSAQFAFAAVAFFATQFPWTHIETYLAFWMALGLLQGVNPGVNRPIVMAVIEPELRGWAFVIMLAIIEPIGWAAYSFGLSWFGGGESLRMAFLIVLVGVMVVNGIAIIPLYRTYWPDAQRVRDSRAGPAFGITG